MKKDKKHILPDSELLSAMESLKVYGGKRNPLDPEGIYILCSNSYCTCPPPNPNTVTSCKG